MWEGEKMSQGIPVKTKCPFCKHIFIAYEHADFYCPTCHLGYTWSDIRLGDTLIWDNIDHIEKEE
jgi:Zn finger protein HypA/HybF involved in hydrogenase expression